MTDLDELIPGCHRALDRVRAQDHRQIADALAEGGVVGVAGEPEVGVTTCVERAVRGRDGVVRLDLDAVSGPGDVGWLVARGLAAALIGHPQLSALNGPTAIRSSTARKGLLVLQTHLGLHLADVALSEGPPDKDSVELLSQAFDALDRLAAQRPLVIWVDHLEAPELTPRHPVKARELLWQIRAIRQRRPLQVLISCRTPAIGLAADRRGAFHGDASWITLTRPVEDTWLRVSAELARVGARAVSGDFVAGFYGLTEGHPATMTLGLCERSAGGASAGSAQRLFQRMASRDDGHAARAMQHARTLHRLGGQVLEEIAHQRRPYRQALGATPQDINRALRRLHLAGLLTQPARRQWQVTNPLVALRLRGQVLGRLGTPADEAWDDENAPVEPAGSVELPA